MKCTFENAVQVIYQMPTTNREHDPLRTAEVLALLKKHEKNRRRKKYDSASSELAEMLKLLRTHVPFQARKSTLGPASRAFMRWCDEQGLPQDVRDHFRRCSIHGAGRSFGPGVLKEETGIIAAHDNDSHLFAAQFLNIGSCGNGDMVVMDLKAKSFPIGFVCFEHYWAATTRQPRKYLIMVADSLYDFLTGWENGTLPGDWWAASQGK